MEPLMSSRVWKCELSTSSRPYANPQRKKSAVTGHRSWSDGVCTSKSRAILTHGVGRQRLPRRELHGAGDRVVGHELPFPEHGGGVWWLLQVRVSWLVSKKPSASLISLLVRDAATRSGEEGGADFGSIIYSSWEKSNITLFPPAYPLVPYSQSLRFPRITPFAPLSNHCSPDSSPLTKPLGSIARSFRIHVRLKLQSRLVERGHPSPEILARHSSVSLRCNSRRPPYHPAGLSAWPAAVREAILDTELGPRPQVPSRLRVSGLAAWPCWLGHSPVVGSLSMPLPPAVDHLGEIAIVRRTGKRAGSHVR